jgi:hypothetical protein
MLTANLNIFRIPLVLSALIATIGCSGGGGSTSASTPVSPSGTPATTTVAAPTTTWFVSDDTTLTATQVEDLFDTTQLYVNVPSANNVNGEIRGEISPHPVTYLTDGGNPFAPNPAKNPVTFSALLGGDQVRPRNVISTASGYGSVTADPLTGLLSGFIVTSGISGSTAHIHDGLPGTAGARIISLEGGPLVWTVPDNTVLNDSVIARLSAGALYFSVTSSVFPEGEIRGQLNRQLRIASLKGASEVPPVSSSAAGVGYLALNPSTLQFSGVVKVSGLSSAARAVVVHVGQEGINGPGIIILTDSGNGTWTVPPNTVLSSAQAAHFNNGELYYNVHTQDNLGGELRGQLSKATVKIGSAVLSGAKQIPAVSTTATGFGILAWNSVTGRISGNVRTERVEGTSVTIHSGLPISTGPAIIALSINSPVTTAPTPGISFNLDLQPIFNARCISVFCHASGGMAPMTLAPGVSYSGIKPLVVPGDSSDSFFYQRLTVNSANLPQMPLYRTPLSSAELNLIKNWIDKGALDN